MSDHTCVICQKTVSKRQSLAFGNGRACREHEEVIKAVSDKKEVEKWKNIDSKMRVMNAVSYYRVYHTQGIPLVVLDHQIGKNLSQQEYKDVYKELDKQGYTMSSEEIQSCLMHYFAFQQMIKKTETAT